MTTRYFTFGPDHLHAVEGEIIDQHVIVKITSDDPRQIMFSTFGNRWSFEYDTERIERYVSRYGGRIVDLNELLSIA